MNFTTVFRYYCPPGAVVEQPCPIGTFSPARGLKSSSECTPCSPGQYCKQHGLNATSGNCSAGFYCKGNATVPTPLDGQTGLFKLKPVLH